MCWKCELGASLMIPSGPNEHLFAVALGPMVLKGYGSEPQVVVVSFSSIKSGFPYDNACEVQAGSHPFITRDSFVYYREPRIYPAKLIEDRVSSGEWRAGEMCSSPLMERVLCGFRQSKRLPRHFNEVLDVFDIS